MLVMLYFGEEISRFASTISLFLAQGHRNVLIITRSSLIIGCILRKSERERETNKGLVFEQINYDKHDDDQVLSGYVAIKLGLHLAQLQRSFNSNFQHISLKLRLFRRGLIAHLNRHFNGAK